jgi:hypothetical protein
MSIGTTQERPSESDTPKRRRIVAWVATGAVLFAGGAGAALLLGRDTGPAAPGAEPSVSASSQPSAMQPSTAPSSGPSQSPSAPAAFSFQPLWPFAGPSDAAAWQQAYRSGGHQPWHLDPAATAVAFSRGYLGYTDLDRATSRTVAGSQAWIGVGASLPDGSTATAAVVHLARIGTGGDAPWEVVGTRDTTLTLTSPAYGSVVGSPVTAGGRITGVDENLVVQVRSQRGLLARSPGVPAGGNRTPWSVRVAYSAPAGTVLTISVSTGGHVAGVERFAVTGVRAAGSSALADGRYAARITKVDPVARRVTVDVIQIFFGADAARAAEEDHAAEVPPPNDVWIRNTSPALRTLAVTPGAPITVNVHGVAESGNAGRDIARTLPELAAIGDLHGGVFWVTVHGGQVTRIAEQYLP